MTNDKGILIKNIFYMLSYAFKELGQNNYKDIACEPFEDVYDLFAAIIVRGVSSQLKQGLYRNYVEREDVLTTLRGKLNMPSTIGMYARGVKRLACEYDEYSENNLFNQILKSTMILLVNHRSVKAERKKSLRQVLPFFAGVDPVDLSSIKWSTLRFDRNCGAYRWMLYMCYFVIDNLLLSTQAGDLTMPVFSDEHMCRLFEKFVLEYYRRHHPEFRACARQIAWNVIEKETSMTMLPILQTDIFLTLGERSLIIDTKYYSRTLQMHYDKRTIHSSNQNQILTYVLNHDRGHTGKTDGMLLYAKTQEAIQPDGKMTWCDGNTIFWRTLDLNQDFEDIKNQLETLVMLRQSNKQ